MRKRATRIDALMHVMDRGRNPEVLKAKSLAKVPGEDEENSESQIEKDREDGWFGVVF